MHTDSAIKWNKVIVTEILPEAYALFIEELKQKSIEEGNSSYLVEAIYASIPDVTKVTERWQQLASQTTEIIQERNDHILFTLNDGGKWISPMEALMASFTPYPSLDPKCPEVIVKLLLNDNIDVVCAPEHVTCSMITDDNVVTPLMLRNHLRNRQTYIGMGQLEKLCLLELISQNKSIEDLDGIQLTPLSDGNFTSLEKHSSVFVSDKETIKLFPGLEGLFISTELPKTLSDYFHHFAEQGMHAVKLLNAETTAELIRKTINMHFDESKVINLKKNDYFKWEAWLKSIWEHICSTFGHLLDVFKDLPILPVDYKDGEYVNIYALTDTIMVTQQEDGSRLPKHVCDALQLLSVKLISKQPEWIQINLAAYLHDSSSSSVLKIFELINETDIELFNKALSNETKIKFSQFLVEKLSSVTETAQRNLRKLKIFEQFVSNISEPAIASIDENNTLYHGEEYPIKFPCPVIILTPAESAFALKLGGKIITREDIVMKTLLTFDMLEHSEQRVFILWLLNIRIWKTCEKVKSYLEKLSYLRAADDKMYAPRELFDPTNDQLKSLFINEVVFPVDEDFLTEENLLELRNFGLKDVTQITAADIEKTCSYIDAHSEEDNPEIRDKATAVLKVLQENGELLRDSHIEELRCIPLSTDRPLSYPHQLKYISEECNASTVKPSQVTSMQFSNYAGSVLPMVECHEYLVVANHYKWLHNPKLETVVNHLYNVIASYKDQHKSQTLLIIADIYTFLKTNYNTTDVKHDLENCFADRRFIWYGDGFATPECIFVESDTDFLDLRPFLRPLPQELAEHKDFFKLLGCFESVDAEACLKALQQIQYDSENRSIVSSQLVMKNVSISILNKLKHDHFDNLSDYENRLFVPVETRDGSVHFKLPSECVYCNASWLKDEMDEEDSEEIVFVHKDLPISTAEALGVPSLTQKVFADSDAMEEWGQEEPLTRRLRTILEEGYVDGFSIPKELFQNADDAKASKMWIMYDERRNEDAKKNLLNADMAQWQGPALWVYNDAEFTEEDFKNITKLSGATKQSNPCTIGKFGLGFCAVYNLTDVPSLISGENIVMFDPHMKYLGKALPGRSPGLKINVRKMKSQTLARKLCNQFRPAENIFGCTLTSQPNFFFKGTLFRFPLRSNQASEISDILYTADRMQNLLDSIYNMAANLLLFNMHVNELKVFHLNNGGNPAQPTLLFETSKRSEWLTFDQIPFETGSVLQEVTLRKQRHQLETHQLLIMEKVHISRVSQTSCSSECSWLVSWATGVEENTLRIANEEEGALPVSAIAVPFREQEGEMCPLAWQDLPDGFYKKGHFFFFLPLPIEHSYPFHIHAPLSVSNDRRHIRTMTDDDNEERITNWNETLLRDCVVEAIIFLLQSFKHFTLSPRYQQCHIWPLPEESVLFDKVRMYFYKFVVQNVKSRVLLASDKWLNISECTFLDPNLRNNDLMGSYITELILNSHAKKSLVDIPCQYYDQLLEAGKELVRAHTFDAKTSVLQFLIPKLDMLSSMFSMNVRDKLIKFAILLHDEEINEKLKKIACIPTQPNGILQFIEKVVDDKSKISNMFDICDGRFSTENFMDENIRHALTSLGMLHNILANEDVLERVGSVSNMHCLHCALERCNSLLLYMEENYKHYTHILSKLRIIPFLPLTCKPNAWFDENSDKTVGCVSCEKHADQQQLNIPIQSFDMRNITGDCTEHIQTVKLVSPSEVKAYRHKNIIASVSPIIRCEHIPKLADYFGWQSNPKQLLVLEHLVNIVKVYTPRLKPVFLPMVTNVYHFLSKTDDLAALQASIKESFAALNNNYIWTGDAFASPKHVYVEAKENDIDLKPYLKPLPPEMLDMKGFFLQLGCASHVDQNALLRVLEQLKVASELDQENTNSTSIRMLAVTVLNKLVNEHSEVLTSPDAKLYIPVGTDDTIEFGLSDKCVYCSTELDQEIIDEDEQDILFVHSDVPLALCKALGVPSLTQKLFADSDAMEEWGQEEPLTRRLKSILDEGYVDGFSVPKELCQNADDAGASKMWILYDERENLDARKNLLNADMSEWQGPALWVYNDAEFTEEDFQNINKLNGATKESDPCTIGKFGLGFCSVYNLTDVPSLISGENIIIFDPHMKYLGKALPGKSPGMRIKVSKIKFGTFAKKVFNQFKPAHNVFGCNLVSEDKQYFRGTLFRLPLRTKPSDISSTVYSKEEMTKLIDITTECAANLLLFNTNVKEIKLFHIAPNETDPRNAKLLFESCKSVTPLYPPDVFRNTSALKEASQRKTRQELHNNQLQVVDEVHVTRTLYCNQSPTSVSETDWIVSWATGIQSKTLTLVYEQEGAVPIGAVALPFERSSNAYCPVKFNDLPSGFYNKGHFYLFLPLPIDHHLPFHINAQFTVSSDRRSFRKTTEEDTNVKFAEWNSCLLGDSIVEAVLLLFNVLSTLNTTDFRVFDIWPFNPATADSFCDTLVDQFYQMLIQVNCPKTFKVSDRWFNLFECKFLEPTLKNHTILGQFASQLFAKNIEHDIAVDIPQMFYEQLLKTNQDVVMERTVTTETFLVDFFLPYLDEIDDGKTQMRDTMTTFAVNLKSPAVDEHLLEVACIPTRPHGTLKHITRIVDDKSPVSALFDETDEYFSAEEFGDEKSKLRLSELGMISATLKDADVLERIQTIRVMLDQCPDCALQRCFQILTYFETNIEQHKTILKQLQNESFLPVLTYRTTCDAKRDVTVSCFAKHNTDRCNFDIVDYGISIFIEDDSICHSGKRSVMPPLAVYSSTNVKLIGSVRPVIECKTFEKVSSIFGWHSSPQLEVVVEHFHNIVNAYKSSIKSKILPMIIVVYKYLANQEDMTVVIQELTQKFEDLQNKFVWFGDGFDAPSRIYVEQRESDIDLKPFLRPLPPELSEFKDFFKCLGCFERVDVDAYFNTLEELSAECSDIEKQTVPTMRRIAVNILNELKDHHIDTVHSSSKSIYFPVFTTDGTLSMKPVDQCVFCDADWLSDNSILGEEDELMFVHSDISNTTAEALGACSLTDKVFSEAEAMEEWGQEEPLTRRLKHILNEGYVDGFSVPKELFQNADDGGATRMWMLYDKRENEDARQNLLSDGMAQWQGPALWVYNDAEFSEEDFKNIIKISGGTKESDSCKIGKFGLGFCAVYNLTDVPSFISGDSIVVFDPHMKYLGKAMPGKSPGLRINVSKIQHKSLLNKINAQFRPYEDVFGCRLISQEKAYFKGTLFRFPLRSQESEISNVIYSQNTMEQFLQKTYNSAANMFLFNMNVEELKIFILEKDEVLPSKAKLVYEVQKRHEQIISNHIALKKASILKDVTQRKTEHMLESNPLRVLHKVTVKRVFHDICDTSETSWLVSWATGVESATLKLTHEEVGAIPLGAVAVPYEDDGGNIKPIRFDELPKGFYDKGHFFFFLPMPVEHSFPFHANGPFAVSSDRRKLRAMTADDFEEKYEKWNRCLLGDSLVQSLIYLLQEMQGLKVSNTYNFYDLWPLCETALMNELPRQFYNKIFQQSLELSIFNSFGNWLSILRCVFLDPELRRNEKVGKLAFDVVATFVDGNRAVDLPKCYYKQLKETDEETIKSKTESVESFILSYFLPNINDLRGSIDELGRNALTVFSILQRNCNIDSKLQESECIPTQTEGILRYINETVDKNASFAELFDDTDNCFPIDDFNETEIHRRLIELGMMSVHLPDRIVLDKAKSISVLNELCIVCANERCSYLLKYLSKATLNVQTIQALQEISFLPVKCKPATWHALWVTQDKEEMNQSENYCDNHSSSPTPKTLWEKPTEMFHDNWTPLVGCVKKVIDLDICRQNDKHLFVTLGVKELYDDRAGIDIATSQLLMLATTGTSSNTDINSEVFTNNVVKHIYTYLEKACDKDSERMYISEKLQQSKVVWVCGVFITSDKVALKDSRDCPPYLYSVKTGILSHFPKLCKVLTIFDHFAPRRIALALTELCNTYGTKPLTDEDLIICNSLLQMLQTSMKIKQMYVMEELFDDDIKAIYAPDEDKVLRSTTHMCFNDYDAMVKSDTMIYVHASISPEIAKAFGVKSKLHQNLEDISEDIEDFYQEEPLTTRIKGLLDGYPCDSSVFKELLQNADDAGATEVHIMFDTTTKKTDNVFNERFKLLQGPALIVYNNKAFTHADLTGIQKLGIGSKRGDPSKTGRYGVGFNAVYNLTDVPSFLTYGPEVENGETLCFFDPNERYIPNVKRKKPGKRYKNTRSIREHHSDVIDGYHCEDFGNRNEGTIFRLPLRCEKMARHSDIKKDSVSQELVTQMLDEFQNELKNILIFLKNITKVSLSSFAKNKLSKEYTVEISMSEDDMSERNRFFEYFRNVCKEMEINKLSILDACQKTASYSLDVSENGCRIVSYKVVQVFGFRGKHVVPEDVRRHIECGDLGLLPYGGVALPLTHSKKIQIQQKPCTAFCFLPLPIETGLPVDIHGYFALSDEKRRSLWFDSTESYKTQWNNLVINHVITPAYVYLLKTMKALLFEKYDRKTPKLKQLQQELEVFYDMFPRQDKTRDQYWKTLTNSVFVSLVSENECFLPIVHHGLHAEKTKVNSIFWTSLFVPDCHFPAYADSVNKSAFITREEILKRLGLRIVTVSKDIKKSMDTARVTLPELNAIEIIDFLCSTNGEMVDRCKLVLNIPVEQSPIETLENCQSLLRYFVEEEHLYCQLRRMPLMISQKGNLKSIGCDSFMYLTQFSDFFSNELDSFVHKKLCSARFFRLKDSRNALKKFTMDDFVQLLNRSQLKKLSDGPLSDWKKDFPTSSWIAKFWMFFWHDLPLQNTVEDVRQMEEMFNRKVNIVGHISLLPAIEYTQGVNQVDLIKVRDIDLVIDLSSFSSNTLKSAFSKMKLKELDTQCFHKCKDICSILLSMVPNFSSPQKVIVCLLKNVTKVKQAALTVEESLGILQYFFEHLDFEYLKANISMLKELPLFITHSGERVALISYNSVVVAPKGMPKEGLRFLSEYMEIVLLRRSVIFDGRKDLLSFQTMSVTDLYAKYIFPNQHRIGTESFYMHVEFIFKLNSDDKFSSSEKAILFSKLSSIAFIEIAGQFYKVSSLFSSHVDIFKTFCHESEFLPLKFRDSKYQQFFIELGLRTQMDVGLFERFAGEVSQIPDIGENRLKKSKLVTKSLKGMPMDFFKKSDLSRVSEIRFLIPDLLPKELQQVCPITCSKGLICYSLAVQIRNLKLCWTTSRILPKYAQPKLNDIQGLICKKLNISVHPQVDDFIRHCMNIGESISKKVSTFGNHTIKEVEQVMTSLYKELKRLKAAGELQSRHLEQLKDVPIVFFPLERMIQKVNCVVIECHITEEIPPYLNRSPCHFSLFNDVFLLLGASAKPSIESYVMVLKCIKQRCEDEEMLPDELGRTKVAVKNLVFYLSKLPSEQTIDCGELYLPNNDGKMQNSKVLVLSNNNYIRKRLGKKKLFNYFIGFKTLSIKEDVGIESFIKLVHSRRPEMLKDIIGEEMMLKDIKFQDNDTSRELERFLHSDNIASGLVRLAKHAFNSIGKQWTLEREAAIVLEMQNVRVRNAIGMKTILTEKNENGRKINGTEEKKTFHIQKDQTVLNIFIDAHSDRWFVDFKKEFAIHINEFIESCFKGRHFILLVEILEAKDRPDAIPDILDKGDIDQYSLSQEIPCSDFPKPGVYVPVKYHKYLDNDCGTIQAFDYRYIAYEIEDPLVDEMSDATPTYVFAEIKRKLDPECSEPLFQKFEVDIGESDFIEVPAFKLYKFLRKDTRRAVVVHDRPQESGGATGGLDDTTTEEQRMKDARRQIRRALMEAWKKDTQKSIVKRLLRKWHPDKNLNDEKFCTKVFQYIQKCLRKLESGVNLSDIDSDDEESGKHSSGRSGRSANNGGFWDTFFDGFERQNKRYNERESAPRGHRRRHSGFSFDFSGVRSETFSYSREAKRWHRQANFDYESAAECLQAHPTPAYNWICYKCHQAVEKALKAAWYKKDANHARSLKHSHDLVDIANGLPANILALTRQLAEQTGESRRMRYPSDDSIPADSYSRGEASKSCDLAKQILDLISTDIG